MQLENNEFKTRVSPVIPWDEGIPAINGSGIFGARRNSQFFFAVPVTGQRPLSFRSEGLPPGLKIDPANGIISGSCEQEGESRTLVIVENIHGCCEKELVIRIGDRICLTPPMGWNSWNVWGDSVDEDKVRMSARQLVSSGLAAHGFSYVNIDDGWQGERCGTSQALQPNKKFHDLKKLCDDVHALGLRMGIYSTPWKMSYASYNGGSTGKCVDRKNISEREMKLERVIGEKSFHLEDASQWAEWGFDYLKYDWYPWEIPEVKAMKDALGNTGRDIVYSLSNSAPFGKAADWAGLANCWRTTGDINDSWESISAIGFSQDRWVPFAGPGHWNDPDMLVLGRLGWGAVRDNGLTEDEQITHISLWCLLAAPLLLGCDLLSPDDFTLRLLSNDEILAVNQDALGCQGHCVRETRKTDAQGAVMVHDSIYAKKLADGSIAVGLFNRAGAAKIIEIDLLELGIPEPCRIRDLWAKEDLGTFTEKFAVGVSSHGARMYLLK